MERLQHRTFFLLLLVFIATGWTMQADAKVIEFSSATFRSVLSSHKKPMFVEFYSPDCYFCQELEPELEDLAKQLQGKITVGKLDSRGGLDFPGIVIRDTPTMMLFKNGKEVVEATADLRGYRTADLLYQFLMMHLGDDVKIIDEAAPVEDAIDGKGVAVLGLFNQENDEGLEALRVLAKRLRSHVNFFATSTADDAAVLADSFGLRTKNSEVFVLKRRAFSLGYKGEAADNSDFASWLEFNTVPLVGNFSMLTYFRYTKREAPMMYLFFDQDEPEKMAAAAGILEEAAVQLDGRVSVATVERRASEEDNRMIIRKTGLSFFNLPALSIRSHDKSAAYAYNQMWGFTVDRIVKFAETFLASETSVKQKCWAQRTSNSTEYSDSDLERYESFASGELTRLKLTTDLEKEAGFRDLDDEQLARLVKNSRKDVVVLFTARWCAFSLQLENTLLRLILAGEFKEIESEIAFVRLDVVTDNMGVDGKVVPNVPAIKYISARFKEVPHWYSAGPEDVEAIVEFINAYHSIRHVEIPGEGPSPFSLKREKDRLQKSLRYAAHEII